MNAEPKPIHPPLTVYAATALVDAHATAVLNYNRGKNFRFGELQEARAALITTLMATAQTQPPVVKESLTTEAEGLVRLMYALLKTNQVMGIDLLPSEMGWMVNAETWIKSLHDTKDEQREPLKPLCEEG